MLTEAQEALFLNVLSRLREDQANGITHLRNREEAFTRVVDDSIEMIEKALSIPLIEIGGQLFIRGRAG